MFIPSTPPLMLTREDRGIGPTQFGQPTWLGRTRVGTSTAHPWQAEPLSCVKLNLVRHEEFSSKEVWFSHIFKNHPKTLLPLQVFHLLLHLQTTKPISTICKQNQTHLYHLQTMASKEIMPFADYDSDENPIEAPTPENSPNSPRIFMEEAHSVTMAPHTLTPRATRNRRPRGARAGSAEPKAGLLSPRFSVCKSSPRGDLREEDRGQKLCIRRSKEVLDTITIKLFQDKNTPGPRLKLDEEYVGSLIKKIWGYHQPQL